MATVNQWIEGARPRTLPAAVAPVLAAIATTIPVIGFNLRADLLLGGLALIVSLALQVGVNYANDYSDGVRGTDDNRIGPFRLTGSGAAPARQVKRAAFICFGVAMLAGLILVALIGQWWLLIVGALTVPAAWFYTGGKKPYGYLGLGEIFVFIFFGLVAVCGTHYALTLSLNLEAILVACAIGLHATAILIVNNLRDIPTDTAAGKNTLAVKLGDKNTRIAFLSAQLLPILLFLPIIMQHYACAVALIPYFLFVPGMWRSLITRKETGKQLIPLLKSSGQLELWVAIFLTIGYVLAWVV